MPLPLPIARPNMTAAVMMRVRLLRARMAAKPVSFATVPEPRTVGDFERGKALCAGRYVTTGFEHRFESGSIWDMPGVPLAAQVDLHSFSWLDDLVAFGDLQACNLARAWQDEWMRRYSRADVLAWQPDTAGYRVLRWINHSGFTDDTGAHPAHAIGLHIAYLRQFWSKAGPGLGRAIALTGLICAELSTGKAADALAPAFQHLNDALEQVVGPDGTAPSRNPAELLEVLTLLAWVFRACDDLGAIPPEDLCERAETIGPVLRALRHGDGSLGRFHGGVRGEKGQLDAALAFAGVRAETPLEDTMGFARLTSGASTILLDAAAPPTGTSAVLAHASTGAIEMNYRSCPIFVSCGSAAGFDPDHELTARSSAAHSTLILEGQNSSQFAQVTRQGTGIARAPGDVPFKRTRAIDGMRVQVGHDGYLADFGVMHARTLDLTTSGTGLAGEDMLVAQTPEEEARFEAARARLQRDLSAAIRFHVHPDIEPQLNLADATVTLFLPNGTQWRFAHDGTALLSLEPGFYFQQYLPAPRPTQQIVLSFGAAKPISRVRWSLVKSDAAS